MNTGKVALFGVVLTFVGLLVSTDLTSRGQEKPSSGPPATQPSSGAAGTQPSKGSFADLSPEAQAKTKKYMEDFDQIMKRVRGDPREHAAKMLLMTQQVAQIFRKPVDVYLVGSDLKQPALSDISIEATIEIPYLPDSLIFLAGRDSENHMVLINPKQIVMTREIAPLNPKTFSPREPKSAPPSGN